MALPIAHAAAGYLVYEAFRPAGSHRVGLLAAALTLANAPDLDFVPGLLLGAPDTYHRGVTHTVGAALVAAVLVALAARLLGRPHRWALGAGLFAGVAWTSHLLIDYLTADVVAPHGARFLWPFSDTYYIAPTTVLSEVVIDRSGRAAFFRSLFEPHTLGVWLEELGVLVCTVAAVQAVRGVRAARVTPEPDVAEEP